MRWGVQIPSLSFLTPTQCVLHPQAGGALVDASYILLSCAKFCKWESGASLSIALVKDEVLATAASACYHLMEDLRGAYIGVDGMMHIPYGSVSCLLYASMH